LILIVKINIKRSQPSAAPTKQQVSVGPGAWLQLAIEAAVGRMFTHVLLLCAFVGARLAREGGLTCDKNLRS
jgi:hypothetical protein